MDHEILQHLGLSPSEIKVYLYLVNKESGYANKISADTKINRTNVYEALDRLIGKGLISYITKNKVKSFEARKPESLLLLVDEKENETKKLRSGILKTVKELRKSAPKSKRSLEASIFEGRSGLKSVFEDILSDGKPICMLAANLQFRYFFGAYFKQWHKKRAELGLPQRTIFPESVRKDLWEPDIWERKFLGKEFVNPTTTIIYGDTCVFVQWSEEPLAIRICNPQIARSHQNYFNALWKVANK